MSSPEQRDEYALPLPGSAAPETGGAHSRRNPVGIAALIVGIATVLLGIALNLARIPLIPAGDYTMISTLSFLTVAFEGFFAFATLILGTVALFLRGRPKLAAAAALGIGGTVLLGVIGNLLYTLVAGIAYA